MAAHGRAASRSRGAPSRIGADPESLSRYGGYRGDVPRTRPDETTRALLRAPLLMTGAGWGSREIAEQSGVSQSMVARVWAQTYADRADDRRLPTGDLRLTAVRLTRGNSLLVLVRHGDDDVSLPGPFMRSPRRPALQTILAADLGRDPAQRPDPGDDDRRRDEELVGEVAASRGRGLVVVTRARLEVDVPQVVVDDEAEWQSLLGPLVRATARQPAAELRALQLRVMERARSRRRRLEWVLDPTSAPATTVAATQVPRPLTDQIAHEALLLVLDRVASGQLAAGDRVTETSLVRGLRTSRTYVREALRTLAAQGLVELAPHRGAVVPVPRVGDVTDTYAARRAMGALLLERAATSPVRDLGPAERALAEMLAIAETGDPRACGDADLRFQDGLAGATSMRHVPGMFRTLTSQVLLLTTVLGLRYVYSIPRMCRDDVEILAAVQRRDADAAIARWHAKIDDAVSHMTTQV